MKLAEYFLKRKIRTLTKASGQRKRCYRSLNDLQTVLVLFDYQDRKAVEPCIRALRSMGKAVQLCVYLPKQRGNLKGKKPVWKRGCLAVDADCDLNFWGFPKPAIRQQFTRFSADMLLDLTGGKSPVMHYLLLLHPVPFKVGTKHAGDADVHDLSILLKEDVHDIPFSFQQIMNYLQIIRSGNNRSYTQ